MPRRRLIAKLYLGYVGVVTATAIGTALASGGEGGAWTAALLLSAVAAAIGYAVRARVSRDLLRIRREADRFAAGDLTHRIDAPESEEIGGLAEALNRMGAQLDEKIRTITRQSHERQAVLSSMIEGVLAVDTAGRVLSLNDAAAELLGIDPARSVGRWIQEVIRNTQLQRFVARALSSQEPVEGDVVLYTGASGGGAPGRSGSGEGADASEERFLQAHGTVLRDAAGQSIGALIVLNDVTRLRRLENLRRDFVANVSHELKTPVTSIKGFVETLRDGAIHEPEQAEHFLRIIARQADRLNAIIEDLLRLSRIEEEGERAQVELAPHRLREVLQSALSDCQALAAERRIDVRLECPADLVANVNAPLIEQAVVNLLDNAIKYSDAGSTVELSAWVESPEAPAAPHSDGGTSADAHDGAAAETGGEAAADGAAESAVCIAVRDHGRGIEPEHLPRLFERFYRVDKARSRKLGGTGLGLAIVKHIAQAHRGSVRVRSTPAGAGGAGLGPGASGSTFTLHLPGAAMPAVGASS